MGIGADLFMVENAFLAVGRVLLTVADISSWSLSLGSIASSIDSSDEYSSSASCLSDVFLTWVGRV